jgi:S1-C subfamily serine protease
MLFAAHLAACALLLPATPASHRPPAEPYGARVDDAAPAKAASDAELAERMLTCVVSVTSYTRVPTTPSPTGRWELADESPYPGYMRNVVASGMVVSEDGTILCCRSPLLTDDGGLAEIVDVELSTGTRYQAEIIASEPTINLAVLKAKLPEGAGLGELTMIERGSAERLRATERVIAIGDPFGSARTFAPGVVMSLPATACYQSDLTGSLIHASMAIAPGAVGGALVDGSGKVVGMLVPEPQLRPEVRTNPLPYVTYAMQIETAFGVAEALKRKRSNDSPWMGFSVLSRTELRARLGDAAFDALAKPEFGIYVDDMYSTGPGTKAGVQRGDFLTEVNGARIVNVVDFQQALYYNFGGTPVQIKVVRGGKALDLMIRIEKRPADANRR